MLDNFITPLISPSLTPFAEKVKGKGYASKHIHFAALGLGVFAAFAAGLNSTVLALILLLLTLCTRELALTMEKSDSAPTRFCGPVFGLIIFGLIVFLAGIGYQQSAGASFALFAYMILQATKPLKPEQKSGAGFQFSPSHFVGKTETQIYLILVVLVPIAFNAISAIYGLMCLITAASRIVQDMQSQRVKPAPSSAQKSEG